MAKMLYTVIFTGAPSHLAFVLSKRPIYDDKDKAFTLLEHYESEFGCTGYVCCANGIVTKGTPINPPANSIVATSATYGF